MEAISFLVTVFQGIFVAAVISFVLPVFFALYARFGARFKYSIAVALFAVVLFIGNLFLVTIEVNKDLLTFGDTDTVLIKMGFPLGLIGFLILFGFDIKRWKK